MDLAKDMPTILSHAIMANALLVRNIFQLGLIFCFLTMSSKVTLSFLIFQTATNPKCNPKTWASYSKTCCTDDANEPCGLGEGDCDTDDECAGDLVCGENNCLRMGSGFKKGSDCCELPTIKGKVLSIVEESRYVLRYNFWM